MMGIKSRGVINACFLSLQGFLVGCEIAGSSRVCIEAKTLNGSPRLFVDVERLSNEGFDVEVYETNSIWKEKKRIKIMVNRPVEIYLVPIETGIVFD